MSQNQLVSVVIPCYNHGHFLKESVESILNQTYNNLEIILVNDGSTDNTKELMEEFEKTDSRVKFINLSENKGKWFALNKAIGESSGEIITSHDADDISLGQRIELQYKCMKATDSLHNLCGFQHIWKEEEIEQYKNINFSGNLQVIDKKTVLETVLYGFNNPGINHYFTGDFETAGVSSMFYKEIWTRGLRFNPPKMGLRCLLSEDSDMNFRLTTLLQSTTILAEKPYLYRRNVSTNKEEK